MVGIDTTLSCSNPVSLLKVGSDNDSLFYVPKCDFLFNRLKTRAGTVDALVLTSSFVLTVGFCKLPIANDLLRWKHAGSLFLIDRCEVILEVGYTVVVNSKLNRPTEYAQGLVSAHLSLSGADIALDHLIQQHSSKPSSDTLRLIGYSSLQVI